MLAPDELAHPQHIIPGPRVPALSRASGSQELPVWAGACQAIHAAPSLT